MDRRAFIGTSAAGLLGLCLGERLITSCTPAGDEYSVVILGDFNVMPDVIMFLIIIPFIRTLYYEDYHL